MDEHAEFPIRRWSEGRDSGEMLRLVLVAFGLNVSERGAPVPVQMPTDGAPTANRMSRWPAD